MIIVFGSVNQDINVEVEELPQPGETIIGNNYNLSTGGKGANQAVAAALAGSKVCLFGCVGAENGSVVIESVRRYGVDVKNVTFTTAVPTGCAYILKDMKGENEIVIVRGANMELKAEAVSDDFLAKLDSSSTFVMMQMEVDPSANLNFLKKSSAAGFKTVLNLAPVASEIDMDMFKYVDYLIVNVHEALALLRKMKASEINDQSSGRTMALEIARKLDLACIITLGSKGSVAVIGSSSEEVIETEAHTCANVIDQTGAGDCYCGYLIAGLEKKMELSAAMRLAGVAASISCSKKGTQTSYPTLSEVNAVMNN